MRTRHEAVERQKPWRTSVSPVDGSVMGKIGLLPCDHDDQRSFIMLVCGLRRIGNGGGLGIEHQSQSKCSR